MKNKIIRLLLLPFGFIYKLIDISIEGSRDLNNKIKYRSSIVDKGACIDEKSVLGKNVRILSDSLILSSSIGPYSYVGKKSCVQNANIGAYCSIAPEVLIGLGSHPLDRFSTSPIFYKRNNTFGLSVVSKDTYFDEYRKTVIGNDVWIGARAQIQGGVSIGNGAVVASNSVVTKDVPPYSIVAGSPAKVIRFRKPAESQTALEESRWWDWPLEEISKNIDRLNSL